MFRGQNVRALLWTGGIYIFWGLAAGTAGIFTPYMVRTLGAGSQAASVALSCAGFVIGILVTVFFFMPYSDRGFRARKLMWGIGAVMQITPFPTILRGTAQGFTFGVARVVAA